MTSGCLRKNLEITPTPSELFWVHDVFGNSVAIARFTGRTRELHFENTVRLDHRPQHALHFRLDERAQIYPLSYSSEEMPDLARSIALRGGSKASPQKAVDAQPDVVEDRSGLRD